MITNNLIKLHSLDCASNFFFYKFQIWFSCAFVIIKRLIGAEIMSAHQKCCKDGSS